MENLYYGPGHRTEPPAGIGGSIDFDMTLLESLARDIYNKDINPHETIDEGVWRAFWDTFNTATDEGFGLQTPGSVQAPFYYKIRHSNAVFSAFRAHAMQKEIAAQLVDVNGDIKDFATFRRDVAAYIEPGWLGSWLTTEYNTAVIRSHMAAQWRQAEANKDILPNLRWVPSTSIHPGADHEVFWDIVRPIDDPFWTEHRPGDRWNCKCGIEATKSPATDLPGLPAEGDKAYKPAPGLENNPGKDAKMFSDKHPYISAAGKDAKKAVKKLIAEKAPAPEEVKEIRFPNGGLIQVEGKQNDKEAADNLKAYTYLAENFGYQYRLLGIDNTKPGGNPDALNLKTGMLSDAKTKITGRIKTAIQNNTKKAGRQGAQEVYFFLDGGYSVDEILIALKVSFLEGRNSGIKAVIVKFPDGNAIYYTADELRSWSEK